VGTFTSTPTEPFEIWIVDAFRDIQRKKIANLIIDLRGNEGGRDDYAMYLLSFLAKTPFRYHQSLQSATHRFSFISYSDQQESFNTRMAQMVKQDSLVLQPQLIG
jgi:C-terminal processing protease CtpA/Prc